MESSMRVLLVEDQALIGESMRTSLIRENYLVEWVRDGRMVETTVSTGHFDLLILDLGLPGKSGLDILRRLRESKNAIPVIVVTARDAVDDRINGLHAGADDYVVKPFDMNDLVARIRSALHRRGGTAERCMEIGGVRITPASREVWRNGSRIGLSGKEYAIVEMLMRRPGTIFSKFQLEERLRDINDADNASKAENAERNTSLEVHIDALRRKLGKDFIGAVRGVGYFIPQPASKA